VQSLKDKSRPRSTETFDKEREVPPVETSIPELLNLLPDPVVIVDRRGTFLVINDRVEEITGVPKWQLLGSNFLTTKLVTRRSKVILMKNLAKRMIGMDIDPYIVEVTAADGQRILAEVNARKINYEGRTADMVIFRDVTARQQATELYRTIFELSPESIVTVDTDGVITSCNTAATTMLGYSTEEIVGRHFLRIGAVPPSSIPHYLKLFSLVLKGNVIKPLELAFTRKDGTAIQAEVRVGLLKRGGETIGLQAISRDITDRKAAEEALRKSEEKYRNVVEHSLQGIAIVQDFRIIYANEAVANITGYPVKELLALPPEKVKAMVLPEDQALVWTRFQDRVAWKSVPAKYELRGIRKNGEVFWLELFAHRIQHCGEPAVQAAVVDITERKKAEVGFEYVTSMDGVKLFRKRK
jgi:PAS domain S-box-containing protein